MTARTDYEELVAALNNARKEPLVLYKGYTIERYPPYFLYRIKPPEGFSPPRMLSGAFTQIERLRTEIDNFFKFYPHETAESSWVENAPPKPKRGRPKKHAKLDTKAVSIEVQP
jgi:hypothetical protein